MTNKIPKPVYQILLGLLMFTFTVIACKSKKDGDKKEVVPDTSVVAPKMDQPMPADTGKMDPKDTTIKTKPVDDPVKVPPAPTN